MIVNNRAYSSSKSMKNKMVVSSFRFTSDKWKYFSMSRKMNNKNTQLKYLDGDSSSKLFQSDQWIFA